MLTLKIVDVSNEYDVYDDDEVNDGVDKYDLYFKYSNQDEDTKTSLSFYFGSVRLPTLQRIVRGDFDKIVLEDSDGTTNGMGWTWTIDQNKCLFCSDSASGGSTLELEFPRHYLVNVLRDKIEVLQDLPFRANVKRAK
uniref:Uncharacterized protein n=1 Tax=Marseillevirus LCMAC101 TaxID=2506602 RepID=A0A481YR88_9VIRU|nr:MAG: protein of unknown function DUF4765 [Marseillevirus LCMAC101]